MVSVWIAISAILSLIAVGTTILWSYLGEPSLSLMTIYFLVFAVVYFSNEGNGGNYLVKFLSSRLTIDLDRETMSAGAMVLSDVSEDDLREYYRTGMVNGYPTELIGLLLLMIFIFLLIDLFSNWSLSNQLYGLSHSAIGSMIVVQDRLRDMDNGLIPGYVEKGRNWIEAACGFTLITVGFLLQLIPVPL